DVVALVRLRRTPVAGVRTAVVESVDLARLGIAEHSRCRNDSSFLRSLDRNLDHLDTEIRSVWIFIRMSARTSLELLSRSHERCSRNIDVHVLRVGRVGHERVSMRPAAGLHSGHLFRAADIGNVENAHAAETIFLYRAGIRGESLLAAVDTAVCHLDRHE